MTIKELISDLNELAHEIGDDSQVMILDSFNGAGEKREINFGPIISSITKRDQNESGDCEILELGEKVVVMGYGCY